MEISESTREFFQDKQVEKVIAIKFEKTWEVNLKLITVEYIRTNFILDFLSCVPLIVTQERVLWLYPFKIFRVTRVSRIIDFIMMWSQLLKDRYQRYQITIDNMYKSMTTVVALIFFLHLMTCSWIAIGLMEQTPGQNFTLYWIKRT